MSVGSSLMYMEIVHERAGAPTLNMLIEARLVGYPHRNDSRPEVKVSPFKRFPRGSHHVTLGSGVCFMGIPRI